MMKEISIKEELEKLEAGKKSKFVTFPFYFDGKPLISDSEEKHAKWGMSLLCAGTMRFRWNENNENRTNFFSEVFSDSHKIVPIELIHSKIIVEAKDKNSTQKLKADGIVTNKEDLVPAVTVADCVPIFLYDKETKSFGAFHSGWKGTGIAGEGVKKLCELYGAKKENICAAIGAHIGQCCYFVDEERAEYFSKNFGSKCVKKAWNAPKNFPFALSLTEANLFVLREAGIKEENIVVASDCTCCEKFSDGRNIFGSFRRQAAFLPPEVDTDTRSRSMTVQAAFTFI